MAKKNYSPYGKVDYCTRGAEVITPDGPGVTVGMNMRKNTNGGPGAHQYIVQLEDGRIRHYKLSEVSRVVSR